MVKGLMSRARSFSNSAASRRRRVVLFTNSVTMGGMERHVELLARELDRERFEVFAVCPQWTETDDLARALGLTADHLATITPDRRYGLLSQLTEVRRLLRQLRAWRVDVVHLHSTTYRGQIWAMIAARLAGARRVYVTEHLAPDESLQWPERWLRNFFSLLVDGIVCVSQKNYLARKQYLLTPARRSYVVNNGVDLNDYPPIPAATLCSLRQTLGLPEGAQVIGTAVRFEPEKGLDDLITAMVQIRERCPNAYLLMVGDGSLRTTLETQVQTLGLADYVRFPGFQRDPRPYLGLMDVFVLPVPVGSMSIALLEAMAMERAVVITFGGEGEAVEHGKSGRWAEPRNPASLADAVTLILLNPELKHAYGQAARQRIETTFSAQQAARQLGELYAR